MTDLLQKIEEVLAILHEPASPESRTDRATARLRAIQYEIQGTVKVNPARRVVATAGQRKGQQGTVASPSPGLYELVLWDGETVTNGYHKADLLPFLLPAQDSADRIALLLHDLAEICDAAGTVRRPPAEIARWIREGGPPHPASSPLPQEAFRD